MIEIDFDIEKERKEIEKIFSKSDVDLQFSTKDEKNNIYYYESNNEQSNENILDLKSVENKVLKYVLSQNNAVREILTSIYLNYKYNIKSDLFIHGPSGVGKTYILKTIAKFLNIPIVIVDLTKYTTAGYVGEDIENVLVDLVKVANGDIQKAKKGIIVFNEADKKITDEKKAEYFNKDVYNSLLCLIEGSPIKIKINGKDLYFDTSNITTISIGALTSIYDKKKISENRNPIGFGCSSLKESNGEELNSSSNETIITNEDLIDYGFPVEYVGRMTNIIGLNNLTKEDLYSILTNPQSSILKNYVDIAAKMNIKLIITDEVMLKIVEEAYKLKTGARSLKRIVAELFSSIYYILETSQNMEEIVIDNIIKENDKLRLSYKVENARYYKVRE